MNHSRKIQFLAVCFVFLFFSFFIYSFYSITASWAKAQSGLGEVSLVEPTNGWEESAVSEGIVSPAPEPTQEYKEDHENVVDEETEEEKQKNIEEFLNWQFGEIKQKYINELENYRRLLKEYEIAKDQYYRHSTLKSLEVTVTKGRELMATRCRILLNYFGMLKLKLNLSKGLSDELQQKYETKINEHIVLLEEHKKEVEAALTRAQINRLSEKFEDIQEKSEALAYSFLVNLSFGKLQYALDNLNEYYYQLKDNKPEIKNPNKKEEFNRAHAEAERYLKLTENSFAAEWTEISFDLNKSYKSRTYYNKLTSNLNVFYNKLMKFHSYLKELVEYDD